VEGVWRRKEIRKEKMQLLEVAMDYKYNFKY